MSDQIDMYKNDVGPGWLPLIEVLDRQLTAIDPYYDIVQIKEKFGGLRYYITTSEGYINTDRMYAIIDTIESLSFRICEDCGRPGEERENGWIRTLCDECEGVEVSEDLVSTRNEIIPSDTITITISREDAEHWAQHHPRAIGQYEQRIANAVRAALEGEQ